MNTYNKNYGRKPSPDPRNENINCYLTKSEMRDFMKLYQKSGMKTKADFMRARIFGQEFTVYHVDGNARKYAAGLSKLYSQFRAVGNNYNQCVRAVKNIYGEKKSLAFLSKLVVETRNLQAVCLRIIELSEEFKEKCTPRLQKENP